MRLQNITLHCFLGSLLLLLILFQGHTTAARALGKQRQNIDSIKVSNDRKRRQDLEELDDFGVLNFNSEDDEVDDETEEVDDESSSDDSVTTINGATVDEGLADLVNGQDDDDDGEDESDDFSDDEDNVEDDDSDYDGLYQELLGDDDDDGGISDDDK